MSTLGHQQESQALHSTYSVDVHFGRFLTLDADVAQFRTCLKRDMPHLNFEAMMTSGDKWVLSVRNARGIAGMAVFSGTREAPVMDFYYAVEPAAAGMLMGAINQWRKR
ncbi:MAG TPA: hypothetical protein VIN59_01370 [Alphaproteobacteria bacterium]